jgi:hypothetical protein
MFNLAAILLIVKNWPSWSNRPLIMGDAEDQLNPEIPTILLSITVLELFWVLVAKFTVCEKFCVIKNKLICFFLLFSLMLEASASSHAQCW